MINSKLQISQIIRYLVDIFGVFIFTYTILNPSKKRNYRREMLDNQVISYGKIIKFELIFVERDIQINEETSINTDSPFIMIDTFCCNIIIIL